MLLVFIGLVAATVLIISTYNLIMQSAEMEEAKIKICNDLEKHPEDLGIRALGDSVYSLCDCNRTANGTYDCFYNKQMAAKQWDKYRSDLQGNQLWK
jgi:hypothetical protein